MFLAILIGLLLGLASSATAVLWFLYRKTLRQLALLEADLKMMGKKWRAAEVQVDEAIAQIGKDKAQIEQLQRWWVKDLAHKYRLEKALKDLALRH